MAVLLLSDASAGDAVVEAADAVRRAVSGRDEAWFRYASCDDGAMRGADSGPRMRGESDASQSASSAIPGSEDAEPRYKTIDESLRAPTQRLLQPLSEAFWWIDSRGSGEWAHSEELIIVSVHVVSATAGSSSLDGVADRLDCIEEAIAFLLQYGDEKRVRSELAAHILLCPWLFTEALPDEWPSSLFQPRRAASDFLPLPIVHSALSDGGSRRAWPTDGRELLRNDLMWLLVASLLGAQNGQQALLPRASVTSQAPCLATTGTARLAFEPAGELVREALERLVVDIPYALRTQAADRGGARRSAADSPATEPSTFEGQVETAADVPKYPVESHFDLDTFMAQSKMAKLGPAAHEWPGVVSEVWRVLAPPLVVSGHAEQMLRELRRAEREMLTRGLAAAHKDSVGALALFRRDLIDQVQQVAENADSPERRVGNQLELLAGAASAIRAVVEERESIRSPRSAKADAPIEEWVERERALALAGIDYPSRGAEWMEFASVVALGATVALATLPFVVVPVAAVVLGFALGGGVVWVRRQQRNRYIEEWAELSRDIRLEVHKLLETSREVVRQRITDARLSALRALLHRIDTARRKLAEDVDALNTVVSEFEAQRQAERRADSEDPEELRRRQRQGIVIPSATEDEPGAADHEAPTTEFDTSLAKKLHDHRILDAGATIEGPPQPVQLAHLESMVSHAVHHAHRVAVEREDAQRLQQAVRDVAELGWRPGRLGQLPDEGSRHQTPEQCTLLIGETIADHVSDPEAGWLPADQQFRPEPAVLRHSEERPVPGLPADAAIAVQLKRVVLPPGEDARDQVL